MRRLASLVLLSSYRLRKVDCFLPKAKTFTTSVPSRSTTPDMKQRSNAIANIEKPMSRGDAASSQSQNHKTSSTLELLYLRYMFLLKTKPIRTKSISAAIIAGLGSIVGQSLTALVRHEMIQINFANVLSFSLTALWFAGPLYHQVYEQLWKMGDFMERQWGSSKLQQVLAQTIVDQTIVALVYFPLYFIAFELSEALVTRRAPHVMRVQQLCSEQLFPVLVANWKIWPIANYINFTFMPPPLRNLFTSLLGVVWNAILCIQIG